MKFASLLFALVLVASSAFAVAPTTMTYQAIFTDNEGNDMPDGEYHLGFHITSGPVGGPPVWSEWQDITVVDGLIEVTLGVNNPLAPTDFLDPEGNGVWLAISVGDEYLHPRQFLSSIPFAFISCWSDSARKAALADEATHAENSTLFNGFSIAQVISFLTLEQFQQTDNDDITLQANVQVVRNSNNFLLTDGSIVYYYATTAGLQDPSICCGRGDIRVKILNSANTVVDESSLVSFANPGSLSAFAFSVFLPAGTYHLQVEIINTTAVTYGSIEFGAMFQGD